MVVIASITVYNGNNNVKQKSFYYYFMMYVSLITGLTFFLIVIYDMTQE